MTHVDIQHCGDTVSVAFKECVYHLRRHGTGWYLSVVDHLDGDESVPGEIVTLPNRVKTELRKQNLSVVR